MFRPFVTLTIAVSAFSSFLACGSLTPDDVSTVDAAGADSAARPTDDGGQVPSDGSGSCAGGDFYVGGGDDGGPSFSSITAALAAANASCAAAKTIHVGAGSYNASSGETFPLVLRGVSLVGAGAATTTIEGLGPIPNLSAPDQVSEDITPVSATLQIGAPAQTTIVQGVRLDPGGPLAGGSEAIVCDQGNVGAAGVSLANTLVNEVTIASYEVGVRILSSPPTPGCDLRLNASAITNGNVGVFAEGNAAQPVSVQLDGANTFQNLYITTGIQAKNGGAFVAYDNVIDVSVVGNKMTDCDQGIHIQEPATSPAVSVNVADNDVETMDNQGIALVGALSVTLIDNAVSGVKDSSSGWGLVIDSQSASYPSIVRARSNSFFGDGTGVMFRDTFGALPYAALKATDFGTADDPGKNTFRCSHYYANVAFTLSPGDAGVPTIPFEGNVWDHAPPVASWDFLVSGVTLDMANASAGTVPACP